MDDITPSVIFGSNISSGLNTDETEINTEFSFSDNNTLSAKRLKITKDDLRDKVNKELNKAYALYCCHWLKNRCLPLLCTVMLLHGETADDFSALSKADFTMCIIALIVGNMKKNNTGSLSICEIYNEIIPNWRIQNK
jgi:hypothetical protein